MEPASFFYGLVFNPWLGLGKLCSKVVKNLLIEFKKLPGNIIKYNGKRQLS